MTLNVVVNLCTPCSCGCGECKLKLIAVDLKSTRKSLMSLVLATQRIGLL